MNITNNTFLYGKLIQYRKNIYSIVKITSSFIYVLLFTAFTLAKNILFSLLKLNITNYTFLHGKLIKYRKYTYNIVKITSSLIYVLLFTAFTLAKNILIRCISDMIHDKTWELFNLNQ